MATTNNDSGDCGGGKRERHTNVDPSSDKDAMNTVLSAGTGEVTTVVFDASVAVATSFVMDKSSRLQPDISSASCDNHRGRICWYHEREQP